VYKSNSEELTGLLRFDLSVSVKVLIEYFPVMLENMDIYKIYLEARFGMALITASAIVSRAPLISESSRSS
jgi:hypothetical protein